MVVQRYTVEGPFHRRRETYWIVFDKFDKLMIAKKYRKGEAYNLASEMNKKVSEAK